MLKRKSRLKPVIPKKIGIPEVLRLVVDAEYLECIFQKAVALRYRQLNAGKSRQKNGIADELTYRAGA